MKNIVKTIGLVCAAYAILQAAALTDSLLSQAQRLYSQGNFEEAAKAYGNICAELGAKEKRICQFKEIKALAESAKPEMAKAAEGKLLSLLSQIEPNDSLFAELSAEDAKLQIMLGQPMRAIRSWNAAQASANVNYFSELFVLCLDIVSAYPESGFTKENCNKVKPADSSLVSLPRKKIAPLAAAPQTPNPAPAPAAQPKTQNKWFVQLAALSSKENAEKMVADFKQKGIQLYIAEVVSGDRKLFAVRAGNFENRQAAETFAEQKIAPSHKDYKIFNNP
jgi:hypothetical protein